MSGVRRSDHIGITVTDLDLASAFFVELGFEVEGRTLVQVWPTASVRGPEGIIVNLAERID